MCIPATEKAQRLFTFVQPFSNCAFPALLLHFCIYPFLLSIRYLSSKYLGAKGSWKERILWARTNFHLLLGQGWDTIQKVT
ncbi:hypothetical protein DL93DRAFT_724076 [Clavulina sp. PMI_390]|nr:hypothetical protein DL93DRAFT_724076 [Clavulina sp. PMI_390]